MASYDVLSLFVAVIAGLSCGFLNTVASSGSAVSLPILMWIGLHAVNANATNRIPVLIGGIAATVDLARRHKIPWKMASLAAVPVTMGAACGALMAEIIPSHDLRIAITGAVVAALVLILTKLKDALNAAAAGETRFRWQEACWFLIIGLWLGFIVLDGATYVLLALVLAMRLPLVEANAIKNFLLVPTTAVAMLIFASRGSVDWALGTVMGAGSIAGGLLGARLAVSDQARRWIVGLLVVVIVGELMQLSIRYFLDLIG
jgi:uncharacterized membrane protein YfcA